MYTEHLLNTAFDHYKTNNDPSHFDTLLTQKFKLTEFKQLLSDILEAFKDTKYASIKEQILHKTINHCKNMKRVMFEYVQLLNMLLKTNNNLIYVYQCVKGSLMNYVPIQIDESLNLIYLYVQLAYQMSAPYEKFYCISHARNLFGTTKQLPSKDITHKYFSVVTEFYLNANNFTGFLNAIYRMAQIERCGLDTKFLESVALICRYKVNRDYGFFGSFKTMPCEDIVNYFSKKNFEKNFDYAFDFKYYNLINNCVRENDKMNEKNCERNASNKISEKDILDNLNDRAKYIVDVNGMKLPNIDGLTAFLKLNNFTYVIEEEHVILKEHKDVSIATRCYLLKEELKARQKKNICEIVVEKPKIKKIVEPEFKIKTKPKKPVKKKIVVEYFKRTRNIFKIYFERIKDYITNEKDIFYLTRKERYDFLYYKKHDEKTIMFKIIDENENLIKTMCEELESKLEKEGRTAENTRTYPQSDNIREINAADRGASSIRRGSKLGEMQSLRNEMMKNEKSETMINAANRNVCMNEDSEKILQKKEFTRGSKVQEMQNLRSERSETGIYNLSRDKFNAEAERPSPKKEFTRGSKVAEMQSQRIEMQQNAPRRENQNRSSFMNEAGDNSVQKKTFSRGSKVAEMQSLRNEMHKNGEFEHKKTGAYVSKGNYQNETKDSYSSNNRFNEDKNSNTQNKTWVRGSKLKDLPTRKEFDNRRDFYPRKDFETRKDSYPRKEVDTKYFDRNNRGSKLENQERKPNEFSDQRQHASMHSNYGDKKSPADFKGFSNRGSKLSSQIKESYHERKASYNMSESSNRQPSRMQEYNNKERAGESKKWAGGTKLYNTRVNNDVERSLSSLEISEKEKEKKNEATNFKPKK